MPYDPADFPPSTAHASIAARMTGPVCFAAGLDLQEWVRDLLVAGFTEGEHQVHPPAHRQHVFEMTDPDRRLTARAEYGSHWPTRTMISAGRDDTWWASCAGLIPARIIRAAAGAADRAPAAGLRLEAAGWTKAPNEAATQSGERVSTWSRPDTSRAAIRMNATPDRGWLIYRHDLPAHPVTRAALSTPPGVIAALALTD